MTMELIINLIIFFGLFNLLSLNFIIFFFYSSANDEWIRIEVVASDLLIIPSGIYHRFTLNTENFIKAKRYFVGEPVWKPYNRPVDEMACRKSYLESLKNGFE